MKTVPMYRIASIILWYSWYYSLMIGPLIRSLISKTSVNKMLLGPSKFPHRIYTVKMYVLQAKWCNAPKSRGQNIMTTYKRTSE